MSTIAPQPQGSCRAKAQGKHMGRPPAMTPEQQKEATRRRARGATLQELANSMSAYPLSAARLGLSYDRQIVTSEPV
jgi:DNA invertase Pin-like site-specific DNA recombinase